MQYLMTIILFTLLSVANSETIDLDISYEEVISLKILEIESEGNNSQVIKYNEFKKAKEEAIVENKLILVKVEADNCKPCDRLNTLLETNENIKKMLIKHTKAVKINTEYESLPEDLHSMGTPTLFLINPNDNNRVVMKLVGDEAIENLEESLNSIMGEYNETSLASL